MSILILVVKVLVGFCVLSVVVSFAVAAFLAYGQRQVEQDREERL
jgi:hypothetical protein